MKKYSRLIMLASMSFVVGATSVGSIIINKKIKANADGVIWQHYEAVNPGFETRGSKEYWINCSTFEYVFDAPTSATVIDRGQPSTIDIASWDATDDRVIPQYKIDAKHIWYGYYPQTRIVDETLLSSLNELTVTTSQGYYAYQGELYAKKSARPYNSGQLFDDGTTIVKNTDYWFKVEPIVWNVLSSNENEYLLLSSTLLINHRYAASSNNYANSELRSFMNGDFYNQAFFLDDSFIQVTEVDNSVATVNSTTNEYTCENTFDKMFSLSYQDYRNTAYGFMSSISNYDKARQCQPTDYAKACGAWSQGSGTYLGNGNYWTRSPHSANSGVASNTTSEGGTGYAGVSSTANGVRPAMNIKVA